MIITAAELSPIVALIAGILILIIPRLLNFIVAVYLIIAAGRAQRHPPLHPLAPLRLASHAGTCNHTEPGPSTRHDVMAKSRSKISRQPVKKSSARKGKSARKPLRKSAPAKAPAQGKWVYAFGGGKAEARAGMRNLLGGKGAGLAEMANLGLPVPPGFTITTEVCTYFYQHGKTYPKRPEGPGRGRARGSRPHHRQEIRRRRKSAAGLGALRRARLDARHDGHRAQSRAQRRHREGACRKVRRPAFRL